MTTHTEHFDEIMKKYGIQVQEEPSTVFECLIKMADMLEKSLQRENAMLVKYEKLCDAAYDLYRTGTKPL